MIPVSYSKKILFFDTLPAQKVKYYTSKQFENIYTFARIYVYNGELMLSLSVFQEKPTSHDWAVFLIKSEDYLLTICINAYSAYIFKQEKEQQPIQMSVTSIERFAGEDEQGWYWGGNLSISKNLLEQIHCTLEPNHTFYGGVLYCKNLNLNNLSCEQFGDSFDPPSLKTSKRTLNQFKIIDF